MLGYRPQLERPMKPNIPNIKRQQQISQFISDQLLQQIDRRIALNNYNPPKQHPASYSLRFR